MGSSDINIISMADGRLLIFASKANRFQISYTFVQYLKYFEYFEMVGCGGTKIDFQNRTVINRNAIYKMADMYRS